MTLTMAQIFKIYSKLDKEDDVCLFASNIQVNSPNQLFLRLKQRSPSWFAHWENCISSTKKAIRSLYSRPTFIPAFIELTHSNWIIISGNNYTAKTWKLIDVIQSTKIGIVIQLIGSNWIKLTPKSDCYQAGCDPIETTINSSDFLIYNTVIWKLSYQPTNSMLNLALFLGGSHETY